MSCVQADPTPDLHPDTLNALSSLMLAQAQDCIVRKAMSGVYSVLLVFVLSKEATMGAGVQRSRMQNHSNLFL